jgi:hypothetical protein
MCAQHDSDRGGALASCALIQSRSFKVCFLELGDASLQWGGFASVAANRGGIGASTRFLRGARAAYPR